MADDIKKTPTKSGDNEEDPKIVAQRFLNIFHQLHIFSDEKRELFNEMLLDLAPQVRNAFRQLPGGSILLDYLNDIENGNEQKSDDFDFNIPTVPEPEQKKSEDTPVSRADISNFSFDTTEFAKVLASTLAQSNAQIIKEFQRNLQSLPNKSESSGLPSKIELVTDETFTQSIAEALSNAISTSEQKRLEDTKIIANSFLELQENINKMVEQNAELKAASEGKNSEKTLSAFQFKDVVEDLVNAQTKFLKETSKSQKEELSSIVSSAIKDSVKLSTQSFAETLKQFYNAPMPITYASPEQKKHNISEIENVIKTQGREFYSIIAAALKESQKNSTQSIIKIIENINNSSPNVMPQKTEEIVKAQTQLFREITREQNKEFSKTIAEALKEGQKQSSEAIMELIKHLPQVIKVDKVKEDTKPVTLESTSAPLTDNKQANDKQPDKVTNVADDTTETKKKKKKKKKDKTNQESLPQKPVTNFNVRNVFSTEPIAPIVVDDTPVSVNSAESWGFISSDDNIKENMPIAPDKDVFETQEFEDFNQKDLPDASKKQKKEKDIIEENFANSELSGEEGKDWEWDYEEVPDDTLLEGKEGKDWEWDYEEVSDDNLPDGEEGKDWEWDYEEIDEADSKEATTSENSGNNAAESTEIEIPDDFKLLLIAPNIDNFDDPYIENIDDIH